MGGGGFHFSWFYLQLINPIISSKLNKTKYNLDRFLVVVGAPCGDADGLRCIFLSCYCCASWVASWIIAAPKQREKQRKEKKKWNEIEEKEEKEDKSQAVKKSSLSIHKRLHAANPDKSMTLERINSIHRHHNSSAEFSWFHRRSMADDVIGMTMGTGIKYQ